MAFRYTFRGSSFERKRISDIFFQSLSSFSWLNSIFYCTMAFNKDDYSDDQLWVARLIFFKLSHLNMQDCGVAPGISEAIKSQSCSVYFRIFLLPHPTQHSGSLVHHSTLIRSRLRVWRLLLTSFFSASYFWSSWIAKNVLLNS